jgi:hypothetical protein
MEESPNLLSADYSEPSPPLQPRPKTDGAFFVLLPKTHGAFLGGFKKRTVRFWAICQIGGYTGLPDGVHRVFR